jgi:hypothetical protein
MERTKPQGFSMKRERLAAAINPAWIWSLNRQAWCRHGPFNPATRSSTLPRSADR